MSRTSWLSSLEQSRRRRARKTNRSSHQRASTRRNAFESLEDRRLLAVTTPVLTGGNVVFNGDAAVDSVLFSVDDGGFLTHNRPTTEGFASFLDLDSVTAGDQKRLVSDITSLTYSDAGLNDTVQFGGASTFDFSNSTFSELSVSSQTIVVSAATINTVGTGVIDLMAFRNITRRSHSKR